MLLLEGVGKQTQTKSLSHGQQTVRKKKVHSQSQHSGLSLLYGSEFRNTMTFWLQMASYRGSNTA